MKKKLNRKGFTLVELIVVIAILAILAGVAIPVYSGYIAKAKEATDLQQMDSIKTAVVFVKTESSITSDVTFELTGMVVTADSITANGTALTDAELASVARLTGLNTGSEDAPEFGYTFNSDNNTATLAKTNGTWTWTLTKAANP